MKSNRQTKGRFYNFRIGDFVCTAIYDGSFTYEKPRQLLFPNAPPDELEIALHEYGISSKNWGNWESDYTCLLVDTGDRMILVDTGAGQGFPGVGELAKNLIRAGKGPEKVDTVVITHAHPDHIGGIILPDGSPTFPNADIALMQEEWSFWASNPPLVDLPIENEIKELLRMFPMHCLKPLRDKFRLIQAMEEIVPGVEAIPSPGHTPGHMAVRISSKGERLYCLGDAFLHPVHIEYPDWNAGIDLRPADSTKSKKMLLDHICNNGNLVMCHHFPFPALGKIISHDGKRKWQRANNDRQ